MKSLSLWIPLVALACGSEPTPGASLTKEQARAMAGSADGVDLCQAYGWYGDEVCDDFCPNPDPDCGTSCGPNTCIGGQVCCNVSCGICSEPGGFCTQEACLGDGGLSDVDGSVEPGDGGGADAGDGSWFGLSTGPSGYVIPDDWEPIDHLDEAYQRAREATGDDAVDFVRIEFQANEAPVPPDALAPSQFTWIYVLWSGEVFGGTLIIFRVNEGVVDVIEDRELNDQFAVRPETLRAAVRHDFGEAFAAFGELPEPFPLTRGFLRDSTFNATFDDPAYTFLGLLFEEAVTLDAGTLAVRADP